MKTLDLEKLWGVMNTLSEKQSELSELNVYISLLGISSNYHQREFESFLEYYSFRIDKDDIVVFNDDSVSWEDYSNNDFSYFPSVLLSFSAEKLNNWVEIEINLQLETQKREIVREQENIKAEIERLQKRLK